jgi:hypothetical protein
MTPNSDGMLPSRAQPKVSVVTRVPSIIDTIGKGMAGRRGAIGGGTATANGQSAPIKVQDTSPAPMTDTAVRPAKDLSISPTIGRSSSPRINLPEQKSVPVTPPPAPTSTVVTPKQQPAKEPLVLQPFIPLQPPPPDYCSDPRFAGTELCQRRGDGTFPALSSTCATTLLAVGSLDALRQHELCGPEVTALLGAAPTLIEAPKPGAAKATDAKGMPLDVPGAVKIVAPGGAPVAVSGERCLAAFLRLNPVVQQRIVGLFAQYPQARAVHGELAQGVMDAPPTFVNWFRDAFSTGSPEASAFCAAVMSAMQGVIPAGAPASVLPTVSRGSAPAAALGSGDDKASVEACLRYLAPLPDTVTLPALRAIGGAPQWLGQSLGHLNGARDLVAGVRRLAEKMSGSDPNRWQALVGFLRSLCAAARAQQRSVQNTGSQNRIDVGSTVPVGDGSSLDNGRIHLQWREGALSPRGSAPSKAATHPFKSGTATFGVSGKGDGVRPSGYPLNITIPNPRTEVRLATRPSGDAQGAVAPGWEGVQSFTGQFGGNQGGAFGTGGQQGGLGEAVIPPTQAATQGGLSTQQILGGIGQIGQTGLGFLNQYLDRESRDHLAELQANASSANAQIAANAQIEIARIQAQAQQNTAALGQNPTQQQVSNALNSSIPRGGSGDGMSTGARGGSGDGMSTGARGGSGDGMSTGAKVGIGVAVAAVVGGGIYVATRKRR